MEKPIDWLRVQPKIALILLRQLVRSRFPRQAFTASEPLVVAFVDGAGYLHSEPIGDADLREIFLGATLLRGSSKQSPVVRLFGTVVQGLVIEILRRGHALARLEEELREQEAALSQALQPAGAPEAH